MHNYIAPEAWSAEAAWVWLAARRAVHEACDAFEEAGAALLPLIDASQWQAQGVLALHELIIEMRTRTAFEVGEMSSRAAEIETLVMS